MYQLPSHNLSILPVVTHYDSNGKITKEITYNQQTSDFGGDIDLTLYDEDGSVSDYFKIPFRSFNFNFINYLYGRSTITNWQMTSSVGTPASPNYYQVILGTGLVNNSNYGITVGTSGSAATQSVNTFKLAGPVAHGTNPGSMSYSAGTWTAPSKVSGSYQFSLTRTFTNNAATNITITEVGWTVLATSNFMFCRDIVNSNGDAISVVVAPTQVLTIKYNFYFPVSNGVTRNFPAGFYAEWAGQAAYVGGMLISADGTEVGNLVSMIGTGNQYRQYWNITGAGDSYGAISIGTGSAPINADDYKLQWITHGSSSTQQLIHSAVTTQVPERVFSTSGSTAEFVIKRTFTNAGTDPVTMREAGVLGCIQDSSANYADLGDGLLATDKGLLLRILTGDQTLASGSSMDVAFKFRVSA